MEGVGGKKWGRYLIVCIYEIYKNKNNLNIASKTTVFDH